MITRYVASLASDQPSELAESPIWDGRLLRWIDMTGKKLFSLDEQSQTTTRELSTAVNAIALSHGEKLLAVTRDGLGWLDEGTGDVEVRLTVLTDDTLELNDGAVDPSGRYWFGSATTDQSARGSLYRLAADRLDVVADGIIMSNGIDWSPDGRVLYHADSTAGSITAWSFDATTGVISQPRLFKSVPPAVGLPDGLTVDRSGRVWVAVWGAGEVWALDARSGKQTAVVSVPTPLTSSCAFGAGTLDTLYITTAATSGDASGGLVYKAQVDARGTPPNRFSHGL